MRRQLAPWNYDSEAARLSLDCGAVFIGVDAPGTPIGPCPCNQPISRGPSSLQSEWRSLCDAAQRKTVHRIDSDVSALAEETKDLVLQNISGTLLVRFVCSDGKMKAGPGEIIFNVSVWVAVIVP
jgi:hypothetical protein